METLHVLVIGTKGIIHSQDYQDAAGKDIFNFDVPLSDEMVPEARGLAFYVRGDSIIYDEFSINVGFGVDNAVSIKNSLNLLPVKLTLERLQGIARVFRHL